MEWTALAHWSHGEDSPGVTPNAVKEGMVSTPDRIGLDTRILLGGLRPVAEFLATGIVTQTCSSLRNSQGAFRFVLGTACLDAKPRLECLRIFARRHSWPLLLFLPSRRPRLQKPRRCRKVRASSTRSSLPRRRSPIC